VFCDNYKTKKTIPCNIVGILFIPIHEDLISPLATTSKKKRIRSAKESDNIIINTEKQQRLAEITVNKNQQDTDSTRFNNTRTTRDGTIGPWLINIILVLRSSLRIN
jgi:hypothetical protein